MTNQFISKEPRYNLSFVVHETGIKSDTLRAWERRYQLPQPQRTEGGHRLFSDFDIQTIKWLIARQGEGMSISQAVHLWREKESQGQDTLSTSFAKPVSQSGLTISVENGDSITDMQTSWIQACLEFNESQAEQVLSQAFAQFPLETVCVEILQSGISKIGALWYMGKASVHQEHFASELATRRLHALVAAAPKPVREKTIFVGCPPGENHTFSVLLTTLLLRYRSWPVIFLGANDPIDQLMETVQKTNPDLVIMVAMRLTTSASLYHIACSLGKTNTPLAFGGWIFEHTPNLSHNIPGYYLGGDLLEAITLVENLLMGSMPQISCEPREDEFTDTLSHFIEMKHHIGDETLNKLRGNLGEGVQVSNIQVVNEFFTEDIIAALSLGDISLVHSELEWVKNLITHHGASSEMLSGFLFAYYEAAQIHLDERGKPILDWLASITQTER